MSEFHFGLSSQRITRKQAREYERVAKKHGAELIEVNLRRNSTMRINEGKYFRWFSAPNRGEPFDSNIRRMVLLELGIE